MNDKPHSAVSIATYGSNSPVTTGDHSPVSVAPGGKAEVRQEQRTDTAALKVALEALLNGIGAGQPAGIAEVLVEPVQTLRAEGGAPHPNLERIEGALDAIGKIMTRGKVVFQGGVDIAGLLKKAYEFFG